jgi:hypothetical protein
MPLLWANAAGVPVIAEGSAPLAGMVQDEHTGLIFEHGELNAGCDRLARLYDDRVLGNRLAKAAAEVVRTRCHLDGLCRRLADAWHQGVRQQRAVHLELADAA